MVTTIVLMISLILIESYVRVNVTDESAFQLGDIPMAAEWEVVDLGEVGPSIISLTVQTTIGIYINQSLHDVPSLFDFRQVEQSIHPMDPPTVRWDQGRQCQGYGPTQHLGAKWPSTSTRQQRPISYHAEAGYLADLVPKARTDSF
jgi:hypothetical protein